MKKTLLFLLLIFLGMKGFAQADLVLTNTNYQSAYIPGYSSVYTVTVTNNGPNDANNVLVTNPIPPGITQFSWTGDNGSSGTNVPLSNLTSIFNVGDTITYTITIFVPIGYVGPLNMQATVAGTDPDPNPANNQVIDTDVAPTPGSADIVVVKTDNDTNYRAGETQTYTITLANHGPAAATNVTIQDLVPAGVVAANVTWSGDNGSSGTGNLNNAIPNMAVGDVIVYTVVMPIPSNFDQSTDLVNTVTTTSATPDDNPLCPGCTDTDTPDPLAVIQVSKTNGQTQYLVDEDTTYTITVTNAGPSDAENVVVTDNMPLGITQMTWSGDNGASGTGNMVDTIASLPVGTTVTYTVTLHVPLNYNTTVINLSNVVNVTSDSSAPVVALDVDTPRPKWVTVDTNTYTVTQLVEDILIDSDCANVSNFSTQLGPTSAQAVGYFHRNNSDFPLKSGVVIRCGSAKACEGPFSSTDGDDSTVGSNLPDNNSIGYPATNNQDLWGVNAANGNTGSVNDVSYIQFNFVPLTDNFSFRFLFASNEYGTYQCGFSDTFAFILKDQVTGVLSNLAVIPGTSTPISVTSIRDQAYNAGCASANISYFGIYNPDDPANADIDMIGQTIPMVASAIVIPNHLYSIKLVIGDYTDTAFDSAVFIEAGSFNVGQANLGDDYLTLAGAAVCDGETVTLETGLNPAGYTFSWYQDDVLMVGETNPTLVVTQGGVYEVVAANGTCEQRDKVTVEYLPPLPINLPADITQCGNIFNLTEIEPAMLNGLNPANIDISYYHTQQDAIYAFQPIAFPTGNASAYPGSDGEIIWVRVDDTATSGCYRVESFTLHIPNCGAATDPGDQAVCDDITNDNVAVFDLNALVPAILGTNNPADYTITFHLIQADANGDMLPLAGTGAYSNISNPQTIYVRMENNLDPTSYSTVNFDLIVHDQPATPVVANVAACSDVGYTLPVLPAGSTYHSATGGNASTAIAAGTVYNTPNTVSTVYVFAQSATTPNCTAEASFTITINQKPATPTTSNQVACSDVGYQLPLLPAGSTYHSASGGAAATLIPAGTVYNTANTVNTVYIFAQSGTTPNCTSEASFTVTINGIPATPVVSNVTACDGYALPALGAGQSYHADNAGVPGAVIPLPFTVTSTRTLWVVASTGTTPDCSAQANFTVTINTTPATPVVSNVTACDGYALPALGAGQSYHADNSGVPGAVIPLPFTVTSTRTLWVVASTGTTPDCSAQANFTVTINTTPATPVVSNVTACDGYALPALGAGQSYHADNSGVPGAVIPLPFTVTSTRTLWVVASTGTTPDCSAQASFTVTINTTPVVADPPDVVRCDAYVLPALPPGQAYHTAPGGSPSTVIALPATITTSQTIWVYAATGSTPNCFSEKDFQVSIYSSPVINTPSDYRVCDDNNDGFSCLFALSAKSFEVTADPSLTVTYHETLTDAQTGANPQSVSSYCNIAPGHQTLYVRVFDALAPLCYSTTTLELYVDPVPVPNPSIPPYRLCDTNNPGDQTEGFDLVSWDAQILSGQSGVGVGYYLSQADALSGTGAINTGLPYNNISNPQQIWIRLENGLSGCFAVSSFFLHVDPLPGVSPAVSLNECGTSSGIAQFDLAAQSLYISGGVPGTSVSYHLTQSDALSGASPLPNPYTNATPDLQVVYASVLGAQGCRNTVAVTLTVTQGPAVGTPSALQACDDNNDGYAQFDLSASYLEVTGSNPPPAGITVSFHETLTDATNGQTPVALNYFNINPTDQTLYVRATYDSTGCYSIVPLALHVNATPQLFEGLGPQRVCDDDSDGIGTFDLTQYTAPLLGGLSPSQNTLTYHLTQAEAQSGTGAITNLLGFQNTAPGGQTIWVRLQDNLTGCFDVLALVLVVEPRPSLPATPTGAALPYTLCDVNNPGDQTEVFDLSTRIAGILGGQTGVTVRFYGSLSDAQAPANELPALYTNTSNAQTLHVRMENAAGCFVLTTMDLRVEPLPVLVPPPGGGLTLCDADGDGFALFDLQGLIPGMLQGAPDITVSFHETLTDAQNGNNAITLDPYPNNVPFVQIVYVRAHNTLTGCVNTLAIELHVVASPKAPILPALIECDQDASPQDGQTAFDLTQQDGAILAAQSGLPSDYTISYHLSQSDAQDGANAIFPATAFVNTTANLQTLWFRVRDNRGIGCANVGSFDVIVQGPPVIATPTQLTVCDDGPTSAVPQAVFDLTLKENEITGGVPGYTVSYYQTQADALSGSNAIATPAAYTNNPNPQTLFVAVEGPNGCRSYTTLTIRVLPLPVPQGGGIPVLEACDQNAPSGTELFDLTTNETYIRNGDAGLVFEYYQSLSDAQTRTNPIPIPGAHEGGSGTVYIRVMRVTETDYLGDYCYVIVEQELIVHPLPAVQPAQLQECDPDASGTAAFTLSQADAQLIAGDPSQAVSDFVFTYYPDLASAQAGTGQLADTYTNTANPQDVVAVVENIQSGCRSYAVVTLTVKAGAVAATGVSAAPVCDDSGLDGMTQVDLSGLDAQVLAGQPAGDFTVAYFLTQAAAALGTPELGASAYLGTGDIYAVVTNTATGCKSDPVAVGIEVEPLAYVVVQSQDGSNVLCVEWGSDDIVKPLVLGSNLGNDPGYAYQWYLNGSAIAGATASTYAVPLGGEGDYTLSATSALGCQSVSAGAFTAVQSGQAVLVSVAVSEAFSGGQTITVVVQGYGSGYYQYQLDQGPILDNGGVFTGVPPGAHTVQVYDMKGNVGCGELVVPDLHTVDYPHYFTPNGDGHHDTWTIRGLDNSAKIYIFDRYGKLIKQLAPNGPGWDGTFNGQPLPSTDYWFTVYYNEPNTATTANKEFKAHFSLKR